MIQLRSDCLVFEVTGGEKIPCSVEKLTIEILADSLNHLDPDVIRHAAAAVLHYFRDDLGRETVTVEEFTQALEQVLVGLGFEVSASSAAVGDSADSGDSTDTPEPGRVAACDLTAMAEASGEGLSLELGFYPRLRRELKNLLAAQPEVVRFNGLRPCAMRLARVRRWCPKSVVVSDEIVRFLRDCWGAERPRRDCALLVD